MTIGRKILLSTAVTVGFFVMLEGALRLLGIAKQTFSADPYVGFASTSRLYVPTTEADGSKVFATADGKLTLFNHQRFPADKGDAFRIFCVGGSTTYGRPYDDTTSFCGWLRSLLPVADPSRRWEVVNAGGVSYASYRVALLMEELIDYEPDLFVVYTGHNEFLERRSYPQIIATPRAVRGIGAVAARTRVWSVVSAAVHAVQGGPAAPVSNPNLLDAEVRTLLDDAVGPRAYTRDDELARKALQHLRFNLARMVEIASSVGAATVLVTPASNLRDSRPFKSEHRDGLTEGELARFNSLVDEGRRLRDEGRLEDSLRSIEDAAEIDPRHAQLAYLEGRLLWEAERWPEARAAFERARDEDICPLRALGPTAGIVREVAAERGVPVVDFERLADGWAEHGVPGADLFLDHVHPTIETHRRLAAGIVEALATAGVIELDPGWSEAAVAQVGARVEAGLDPHTHANALMNLSKVLGWAGKLDESYRLARQAVELFPEDSMIQYNAGLTAHLVGQKDLAVAHYRRSIELQPDADEPLGNLGVLVEEAGQLDEAIDLYRRAIRFARTPETANRNRTNLARALTLAGYRDYTQGRRSAALSSLTEAAELAPTDPEILGRLGIAQLASGASGDAASSFERALTARPDDAALMNRLALALALDGQVERAAATYARAISRDPSVADLPDNLFRVLATMGRSDLADRVRRSMGG
ncbi:MAG: tetratricopeptide repeat protein [Thermoanaerobaculales bacterium]|jgi:tetratricopeptide (TPR) repeat protein|nr:tetratricopeptide repeat protein [Thermoanaerobaculales bacterium]